MVNIRSVNEIILNLIDFFKLTQPDLDTKPGTVARDLFIDAPATQLSLLYDELGIVSSKQSLRVVTGSDLDKLAKNFGISRRQPTPATGVALLTFSSINAPVNIDKNSTVISTNGVSFSVVGGVSVVPSAINFYKSVAAKFRDQLDLAGISDTLAVEVTVIAGTSGSAGNIGKYSLNKTNIAGVSNVTNINPFSGGTDQETDSVFRSRVLSTFGGSSVGTALGYQNAALSIVGVQDAVVIEPGDALMTRDGTEVSISSDGTRTVVSEGTGGKVDVVILGSNLQQTSDTFIYRDKSNNNDPSDSKNNYVIGQIAGDENKTINRKRVDNINNNQLPQQPVNQILQVSGSISGANFVEKTVDSYGRVSGNYELIKDTGVYGGSPWGFDTFHWISNKISLFQDDRIKGQFNGQDPTTFTGVIEIPNVQQSIPITNEDSDVTSDRSVIKLLHTPATNVTRVFNVNTGERYLITNQNLDETGVYNTTGRIKISGNTLPVPTDVLQVDYSWIVSYDQYSDYDGLSGTNNVRSVIDSIDWGYSSTVRNELVTFTKNVSTNFFTGATSAPVSVVSKANKFTEIDGVVQKVTSGIFINRYAIVLNNLKTATVSVDSVKIKNTNAEQYNVAQQDGTFTSLPVVVGIEILYSTTIILPTDTIVSAGDRVTIVLDSVDVFHATNSIGSISGTQITIPASNIDTSANTINLLVSYIANAPEIFSSAVNSLPSSRSGNGFVLSNNNGFNNFTPINISRRESQSVQKNFSNEFFVELNVSAVDYALSPSQITSVIRLSDSLELWNSDYPGSVIVGASGNYQLILTGYNSPTTLDKVLIIYSVKENRRFQPFTFQNKLIKYRIDSVSKDGLNQFYVPINNFINETPISFKIFEPNTDIELFSITDGYLVNNTNSAILGSYSVNFSSLTDLTNKKVKIYQSSTNNNGTFDIINYNLSLNTITISSALEKINYNQISIIRIVDGQEIWNSGGTIDFTNNKLILPTGANVLLNDAVYVSFFNFANLKQNLTRLSCTTSDQNVNIGTISIQGTTATKAADIVFTATSSGLKLNAAEAIRKALGLSSSASIPSTVRLGKICKLEKVTTISGLNNEVSSVLATYDVKNTTIKNNLLYSNDCLSNQSLSNLEFVLPATQNNTLNTDVVNLPKLGDKLRITFYYVIDDDSENLSYTRNGTLYTNKTFALINKMYVNSGFKSSQSTRLTINSFTQPNLGTRYKAIYDYTAPKQNERIVISYNFNQLVSTTTFAIENTRPVNADVLVRAAKEVKLDLTMNVVISDTFKSSTNTILENLKDKIIAAMTANNLGAAIDQATLINVAQGVNGIARARILYFNKAGELGQILTFQSQKDEYFSPNNIVINTETR